MSKRDICPKGQPIHQQLTFKGKTVTREKILSAMQEFDRYGRNGFPHWRKYRVIEDGKEYPPKNILSRATGISVGRFYGGWTTNRIFCELGFRVIEK